MSTFSEILKRERENKGYSKAELARKLNIPYTTYQNYENGREPKIDVIKQISEELGINPSVFFDLENRDPLYERNFHPIDHSEIECIMLYDSGKFEYMKDTFDNHRKELYRQSWKVHDMFDNFYNALIELRAKTFVEVDHEKLKYIRWDILDILERTDIDTRFQYEKTIYESQFMNEECINEFKERNPDYKKQIINKILFPNNDFNFEFETEESIDGMYKVALAYYFKNKYKIT